MTLTEKPNGFVAIDTDENHIIHRKGDKEYPELRHAMVKADQTGRWEELTVAEAHERTEAARREEAYTEEVKRLIAERYSQDEELAIQRKFAAAMYRSMNPTAVLSADDEASADTIDYDAAIAEFGEYNAYVEQCKTTARANILT